MDKICTKCNLEKKINEFSINNRSKDGHASWCKECKRMYNKLRYNKEEKRQYYLKHKEYDNRMSKEWKQKHPDYIRDWRAKNPDYDKIWYENNKEKCADAARRWYNLNKSKKRVNSASYRARKINQTVDLSDSEYNKIQRIYGVCTSMNLISINIKWHVDHVTPLSKEGLHHPDNLQILEASANLRKGSKL